MVKERRIILRLDAALYSTAAIRQAIRSFSHIARIHAKKEKGQHVILFRDYSASIHNKLGDEFSNYVLSCMVNQR